MDNRWTRRTPSCCARAPARPSTLRRRPTTRACKAITRAGSTRTCSRKVARATAGRPAPRLLDLGLRHGRPSPSWRSRGSRARTSPAWTCLRGWPRPRGRAWAGGPTSCSATPSACPSATARSTPPGANDSFHHYPDPERAAFQAWRVLAPGGALVVGDAWQPAPARAIMNAWMPRVRARGTSASTPRPRCAASSAPGSATCPGAAWARPPASSSARKGA